MPIEPEMHDPDWNRYLVRGQAAAHVGDPTRWGAQVETLIPATGEVTSTQVLAASTRDAYSRSWALLGTLELPAELWNAAIAGVGVSVSLDVSVGVGQTLLTQRLSLFEASGPLATGGLCETQYLPRTAGQGPYLAINTANGLTRSFAAIGALVGQSINIRARYSIAAVFASLPARSLLSVIVCPFAAGEGL
jgi:hypothetical protein